jgi:hypothetical protein
MDTGAIVAVVVTLCVAVFAVLICIFSTVSTVSGIKHNRSIYYWQNTSYKPSGSKVAYVYPIPWGGYFSIWREYWG